MADALALSRVADLGEVGITGPAAVAIAAYFGNLDEEENVELELVDDPVAEVLAGLGLLEHLPACHEHEMDLCARPPTSSF